MTDYTPTTEQVRNGYLDGDGGIYDPADTEAFDRWLVEHDQQTRWQAFHDAYWEIHSIRLDKDAVDSYYNGVQTAKNLVLSMAKGTN